MSPTSASKSVLLAALCLSILGCQRETRRTIHWSAAWSGQPIGFGPDRPAGLELEDLRFFVHDLRLITEQGREVPAALVADGRWQTDRVALIDLAPGGDRQAHPESVVMAPEGRYTALRFRLGVPFELNHANPAIAEGPLAIGAMNWSWQGGYKFLKLDGRKGGVPFRVHVGSTECEGPFGHIRECHRPNRGEVTVPIVGSEAVVIELAALVPADLKSGARCEGEATPECTRAFAALGLDLQSGRIAGGQNAFRAP